MNTTSEKPALSPLFQDNDLNGLKNEIDKTVSSKTALKHFFLDLFQFSASNHRTYTAPDDNSAHPLRTFNSLKNLAALRLESPSRPIVEKSIEICHQFERSGDRPVKPELKEEELQQPLFTQDFLWALTEGETEKARHEAAKIVVVSDNPSAVMEMVMEVTAHHMDALGAFVYGVYRSAVFCGGKKLEPFLDLVLTEVTKRTRPMEVSDSLQYDSLHPFLDDVLRNGDDRIVSLFSTALRLWDMDSVRQSGYRKGLKVWADRKFKPKSFTEDNGVSWKGSPADSVVTAIEGNNLSQLAHTLLWVRSTDDWSWATDLAEKWIESFETEESDFLMLDSLQSFTRVVPEQFMPLLAVRLLKVNETISDR